nr:pentatricopeptide repeat-containing protein At2g38420, mitochondrial [Ipomoea batatas]
MLRSCWHFASRLPIWQLRTNLSSFSFSYSSSSKPNLKNYYLRKRRKWPRSPYKTKWHESFGHQLAMQSMIERVLKSPGPTNPLSALVDSFADYQCDPTPSAYQFVIKEITRNPCTYDLIPKVLDHLQKVDNFEIPEGVFVYLIKFYGDIGELECAVEVFLRIPRFRCAPTMKSLNALLSVLCKSEWGLRNVPEILNKSQLMNIQIDGSSFGLLIRALCKIGKVDYAVEMLNCMVDSGFDLDGKVCSLILSTMCEQKGSDEFDIVGFLEETRKLGFSPRRLDFYNVMRFLVMKGKGKEAAKVLKKMRMDGISPDIECYDLVLEGVVLEGEFEKADKVFDELLVLGLVPTVFTYNRYINGLCKQNKVDEAIKMLASMEELGCRPDLITYNTVLEALCGNGMLSAAREVVGQMKLKGVQMNCQTYEFQINNFIRNGEIDEACQLLRDMLNIGFVPQSTTFEGLLRDLCHTSLQCSSLSDLVCVNS